MGGKHQKCYCGEKNCLGYLGEKPPPARPSPKAKHKKEEKPNSEIYVDQKDILEDDITLSQYCDYILDFYLDNIPDEKVIKKRKIFLCRNIRHTQDVWKEFYVDNINNSFIYSKFVKYLSFGSGFWYTKIIIFTFNLTI